MTEAALHRAVAKYLAAALRPPVWWSTIGHGGGGKVRGAQLKAMGVKAGVPDIIILRPDSVDGPGRRGLALFPLTLGIELKSPTGRQSSDQKSTQEAFVKAGCWYSVCRSVEDVQSTLDMCHFDLFARLS